MLLVLQALKNTTPRQRITGRGLINWFFPLEMKNGTQDWRKLFDSLKEKLKQMSPRLADNLIIHQEESILWSDTKDAHTKTS